MVLHGGDMHSLFGKDLFRTLDLCKVVVGDTHTLYLTAFYETGEERGPLLHIRRIVNPVDVDIVRAESFKAAVKHILYGISGIPGNLGRELRGDKYVLTVALFGECGEYAFRSTHSIHYG